MSHFTVAVITDSIDTLEEMLEPYNENIEVKPYIDKTKEEIIKEAKERQKRIIKNEKDGKEISSWGRLYLEAKNDKELYKIEIYDDEQYDENGNHLTTYNPNSKWDWYEIGGRWHNTLLTRIDNENVIGGSQSWGNLESSLKKAPEGYKWVDGAKIKDIDFKKKIEFQDTYNKAIRFWGLYIEGQEPKTEEEKELIKWQLYKKEYYIERYETKENYAKMESIFTTWALLDETGWHEQGKMGWWACNDSTKDSELLFIEKFTETINKPENQDKYLIIVDCHI